VAQEVEVAEMEAASGWKRGGRRASAMAKQGSRRRTDGEAEAVWSFIRRVR
jgi:hypothetical protein